MTAGSTRTRAIAFRPVAFSRGQFPTAWLVVGVFVASAGAAVIYLTVPTLLNETLPAHASAAQWLFFWPTFLWWNPLGGILVLLWWAFLALLLTLGIDRLLGRLASRT